MTRANQSSAVNSTRRISLVKNLKRLTSRIESRTIPIRVAEVYIFGSFLRFKEDPGDMDLILFTRGDAGYDANVEKFRQFVNRAEEKGNEESKKILESLISDSRYAERTEEVFGNIPLRYWTRYLQIPKSRRGLSLIEFLFNAREITGSILLQGLKRIRISDMQPLEKKEDVFGHMAAKTFHLVWSETEPDVDKHLLEINNERFESTRTELENLLTQAEQYQSRYDVYLATAKSLIDYSRSRDMTAEKEKAREYIVASAVERGLTQQYLDFILGEFDHGISTYPMSDHKIDKWTNQNIAEKLRAIPSDKLGEAAEESRITMTKRRLQGDFLGHLIYSLTSVSNWAAPEVGPESKMKGVEERILHSCFYAMQSATEETLSDKEKRDVLSDISLQEFSRMILFGSDGSKSGYYLAKTEDELERVSEYLRHNEHDVQIKRQLRPVIKATFRDLKCPAIFIHSNSTDGGKTYVAKKVHLVISLLPGKDVDWLKRLTNSRNFVRKHESYPGMDVELEFDVTASKGDKLAATRIIEKELSELQGALIK